MHLSIDPELRRQLDDVRRDFASARTLPSKAYHDPAWFEAEKASIFMRDWLMVGRAEEVANPGDFFSVEIAKERLLIVRGHDGVVRAMSPSCRHRGAIVAEGSGNARVFVCPYHRWTYATDGRLMGAPEMNRCPGFDKGAHPLVQVACQEWEGFLFVNFAPDPQPLLDHLGDLPQRMARYRLSEMRVAREKRYRLACNWKSYMDNSVEAYHVSAVHGRSLEPVAPMSTWHEEIHPSYYLLWTEFAGTLGVLKGETGFPAMPGLSLDRPERHTLAVLPPSTVLTASVDAIWWVTLLPVSAEETVVVVRHAFPAGTETRPDFEEVAERYYRRFDIVNVEDNEIVEIQHRGIVQALRRPGPFAPQETLVHAFSSYVTERVTGFAQAASAQA